MNLAFLAGCRAQEPSAPPVSPKQWIEGFSLSGYVEGKRDWGLEAKQALVDDKKQEAELKDQTLTFFQKSTTTVITSDAGRVDLVTQNMEAWGHVQVYSGESVTTLKTERLFYDDKAKKISSEDAVWLKRGNVITRGTGFVAKPDLSRVIIKNSRVESKE